MNECLIKWTGSKRKQAKEIVDLFPKQIETYYEQFVGGASVAIELMLRNDVSVKNFVLSDINNDLIHFYEAVINHPKQLIDSYADIHNCFVRCEDKKTFYEYARTVFNQNRNISLFLFLTRTSYNGLVRYNQKGDYNVGYHFGRDGIKPDKLGKIINYYSELFNNKNVKFECCSYSEIKPNENDFCYFDPPYKGTGTSIYFGKFNDIEFFNYLRKLNCKYAISYDGYNPSNNDSISVKIDNDLYKNHYLIDNGISSFRKLHGTNITVYESIYCNYDPEKKQIVDKKRLF
jgi:DNA adenine methylase